MRIKAVCAPDRICVEVFGSPGDNWVSIDRLSPFETAPDQDRLYATEYARVDEEERAKEWARLLQELALKPTLESREAIAKKLGVSVRTVGRHFACFLKNPTPESQVSAIPGPPRGSRRLDTRIERVIDESYEEVYLRRESPRISAFCEAVAAKCRTEGLHAPSRRAVEARLACKDPMRALRRRKGNELAHALQAPSISGLDVCRPLQVVQIDHAIVDAIVVSEETRAEIGRPWITIAIDVFSRVVVGWHISLDVPNQTSVGLCIEHACFPKRDFLRDLGVEHEYPVYGKAESFHWDNAWSFQAKAIQIGCDRRGIETVVRPVRKPHWGAYIERYIGTLMGKVHLLRGTTFSNPTARKGYASQSMAVMTLRELKKWIAIEITKRYFYQEHKGLEGRTPASVWSAHFQSVDGGATLPAIMGNRRDFLLSFLPRKERKVSREGVQLFGLFFWDPALTPLVNHPRKFRIHYRQDDMSLVWLDAGDGFIDVPILDRSTPAFSLREIKEVRKKARQFPEKESHRNMVAAAVLEKRAIEDEAADKSRYARRSKASRPPVKANVVPDIDYSMAPLRLDPRLGRVR